MTTSPLRVALLGLLAAVCAACAASPDTDAGKRAEIEAQYAEYREEFPDVPEIDARKLKEWGELAELPVIVDVRTPEEQAVSMIPGAITKEAFEANKDDYEGQDVITYCTIGYRSGLYAKELRAEGFSASNLKGSVLAWAHEGGDFVDKDGKPTQRVHVYGESWNLLPEGYEPVW